MSIPEHSEHPLQAWPAVLSKNPFECPLPTARPLVSTRVRTFHKACREPSIDERVFKAFAQWHKQVQVDVSPELC